MGINRITKNEERLDTINDILKRLEKDLTEFEENQKELCLLNEYYGSKNWFQDKEDYENGRISKIKAGVLSEDAVWNLNERIDEIMNEMQAITSTFLKKKK